MNREQGPALAAAICPASLTSSTVPLDQGHNERCQDEIQDHGSCRNQSCPHVTENGVLCFREDGAIKGPCRPAAGTTNGAAHGDQRNRQSKPDVLIPLKFGFRFFRLNDWGWCLHR